MTARNHIRHIRQGFAVLFAAAFLVTATASCSHVDDTRVPNAPVNLVFRGQQSWDVYGVHGALDSRRFIKDLHEPAGFFYAVSDYTGFGGLLLVADYYGNPVVYDLCCPVECKRDIRVFVNDSHEAECPVCHSTYAVFENFGTPLSGVAAERGFGLTRYRITASGADRVITR